MKAPAIADCEHHAGFVRGGNRGIGARTIERDRFFHVDVLAGHAGRHDLLLVQAVGRGQHDRIDIGIGEDLLIALDQPQPVVAAKILRWPARARVGEHEPDCIAPALHGCDQRAPPASQSNDGCIYHRATWLT